MTKSSRIYDSKFIILYPSLHDKVHILENMLGFSHFTLCKYIQMYFMHNMAQTLKDVHSENVRTSSKLQA